MSSETNSLESRQTPKGVAVYSRDMSAVKSISGALSKEFQKDQDIGQSTNYVVIQQSSVSAIDNVCVASVLDIAMVGADVASVRKAVGKIKQKEPGHPIFLVGEKEALVSVMDDLQVKKAVTGGFALPLSGGGLLMDLNMSLEFEPITQAKAEGENSEFNWRMVVGFFVAAGLIAYWYSQSSESDNTLVSETTEVRIAQESVEQDREPLSQTLSDGKSLGEDKASENTVDQISRAKDSGLTRIKSNVVPIVEGELVGELGIENEAANDKVNEAVENEQVEAPSTQSSLTERPLVKDSVEQSLALAEESAAVTEGVAKVGEESTPLFDSYHEEILGKARAALKKGYIVGPEEQSAWYYFRQVLDLVVLDDRSDQRRDVILDELEGEFILAVELGKFGRSTSIYRVMKDLNPLNPKLDDLNQRFEERFKKPVN